ncbi:hypothetical protein TIFTF001_053547, partial [Ficus carica]
MRRRVRTPTRRRTRRVITHYFEVRKSSQHRVNSCPNPPSSTVYSSSASNSITPAVSLVFVVLVIVKACLGSAIVLLV